MKPTEKLAVLTAMKKALDVALKEARAEADDLLADAYEDMGVEKMALKLNGDKVGELLVTFTKDGFEISNPAEFEEWALDYGLAEVRRTIRPDMMESVIRALENVFSPEVMAETVEEKVVIHPDWELAMENVGGVVQYMDSGMNVPGVRISPRRVKGTMVRGCEPDKVIPIVNQLPEAATLLLGGAA